MKTYPIYQIFHVRVRWEEDRPENCCYPDPEHPARLGLPEGRRRSSYSGEEMPKENSTIEQMEIKHATELPAFFASKGVSNPSNINIEIAYKRSASWCLTWFNHFTHDTFANDAEVLDSFSQYIQAAQLANYKERRWTGDGREEVPYVLMGAEDRYRWHGEKSDSPPPCRCGGCKEWGLVRINH